MAYLAPKSCTRPQDEKIQRKYANLTLHVCGRLTSHHTTGYEAGCTAGRTHSLSHTHALIDKTGTHTHKKHATNCSDYNPLSGKSPRSQLPPGDKTCGVFLPQPARRFYDCRFQLPAAQLPDSWACCPARCRVRCTSRHLGRPVPRSPGHVGTKSPRRKDAGRNCCGEEITHPSPTRLQACPKCKVDLLKKICSLLKMLCTKIPEDTASVAARLTAHPSAAAQ